MLRPCWCEIVVFTDPPDVLLSFSTELSGWPQAFGISINPRRLVPTPLLTRSGTWNERIASVKKGLTTQPKCVSFLSFHEFKIREGLFISLRTWNSWMWFAAKLLVIFCYIAMGCIILQRSYLLLTLVSNENPRNKIKTLHKRIIWLLVLD